MKIQKKEFKNIVSNALIPPYGPVYIELISSVAQTIIENKNFEPNNISR